MAQAVIIWIVPLVALLAVIPGQARAVDISTPEIAEQLCATAEWDSGWTDWRDPTTDPLIRVQQRHAYTMTRLMRLTDAYTVTLDTSQYGFLPDEGGALTVDTLEPFPLFEGLYALDLGPAPEIAMIGTDEELEAIRAGFASDQILLRLEFVLVSMENPGAPYCVSDGERTRILGRLLAATLVNRSDNTPIAQAQTERLFWGRVHFGIEIGRRYVPPHPRVQVTTATYPDVEPPTDESEFLRVETETRLMPCYMQGLSLNGRLQGAVVVSYQVAEDGQVVDPTVTIDAVDQPLLTGCVVSSLSAIAVPRQIPRTPYAVRMTIIFRLD